MKSFKNALVFIEGEGIKKTSITFDKKILSVTKADGEVLPLPEGAIVCPGFIDEHIHGAGGADAMDGTIEALSTIAETVAKEGTTTFLATTMTQSKDNILRAMKAVKDYRNTNHTTGARVGGIHLEGPFIAAAHKGAQPLEYIAEPDISVFDEYNKASGNAIKIVSLAPEIEGMSELIKHIKSKGIVASIGHSSAKVDDIQKAIIEGANHVTHTYNAQTALHHREIGVVGSALLYDELACELICDGIHVSIPAMQLLCKCKNEQGLILITDAMRAKGLPDGVSELGGQTVYVKNGEARLSDGTLAGSVLKMNNAIKNAVTKVGISLERAIESATINPAIALGISDETGSIKVNKCADITVLDKDFEVLYTIRDGEIIYRR